jgi:beta-lactamase superfamily II metal-dependent hydrolase
MNIYTLNVSQGQFVVVTGSKEALVIDTYVPLSSANQETEFVKGALTKILAGKKFIGLMVTGFDDDHFCEVGMKLVLNKYRPDWLMYPKYFKKSKPADACFSAIDAFDTEKKIKRYSMLLKENKLRFFPSISEDFSFEVFSPHAADMTSSNNCSLVVKVKEKSTGATYLVTGDAENDRWETIVKEFGSTLKADVLAAAHHGSDNGITEAAVKLVKPDTIIVSAGVGNQYGHPHPNAKRMFERHARVCYQTNTGPYKVQ